MISLGRCDIKMLLEATDDLAQRAFAFFRRGCARIATGHLPGGAHAVVVIRNDRDVHGAVAARGRAQTPSKPRPRAPPSSSATCRALSSATRRACSPFFKIALRQRLNANALFCAYRALVPRSRCATPRPQSARRRNVWPAKLRTWAAPPDGARAPAVWAWGSSLRAAPVSWQPCAHVGWLPPSRGSCAPTVFHTPCDASSRDTRKCFPIVLLPFLWAVE